MRKEADDVGPKAELDHWKKRMAKFNSLLDQIKGTECKAVVGVLHAAKSKLLKVCYSNNYVLTYPHGPMEPVDSIHKLTPLYPGLGQLGDSIAPFLNSWCPDLAQFCYEGPWVLLP